MSKVADIFVGISGSSAGLSSALNKGISAMQSFGAKAMSLKGMLVGLGSTLVAGAATTFIEHFVQQGMESIVMQTRLAKSIGMSTQAFTGLSYAAKQSGVDMESLGTGLEKLAVKLADADDETLDAIKRLGLMPPAIEPIAPASDKAVEALSKLSNGIPTGTFKTSIADMVDSMSPIKDASQRAKMELESLSKAAQVNKGEGFKHVVEGLEEIKTPAERAREQVLNLINLQKGETEKTLEDIAGGLHKIETPAEKAKRVIEGMKDIRAGGMEEAFGKIVAAMEKIENPAEKASLAMKLFGKGGLEMLPLLTSGKKTITEMAAEAKRLGLTFTDEAAEGVMKAHEAMNRVKESITALQQQIAIKLAPTIEMVANAMTNWLQGSQAGISDLVPSMDAVSTGAAVVADIAYIAGKAMQAAFLVAQAAAALLYEGIYQVVNGFANLTGMGKEWAAKLRELRDIAHDNVSENIKSLEAFELPHEKIVEVAENVKNAMAKASTSVATSAKAIGNAQADAMNKATIATGELIDKMKLQIKTFGMTSDAAEIYKLSQQGADKATIDQAKGLAKQLEMMERNKAQMEEWANDSQKLREEIMTPVEKAVEDFAKLNNLFKKGFITLEQFKKGSDKIGAELNEKDKGQHAGAALKGSQEARDLILRNKNQNKETSLAQKQLKKQTEQVIALKQIVKNTGEKIKGPEPHDTP